MIADRPLVLSLCARALSDLEARTAAEQRAQEATTELMALTSSRQAMYDVMVGASRGSTQLAPRLDEARYRVDLLVSAGVRSSVLTALTLVGSHYDGVDYDAVGGSLTLRSLPLAILPLVVQRSS